MKQLGEIKTSVFVAGEPHLNIQSLLQAAADSGVVPPEAKEALPEVAEAPVPIEGEPVHDPRGFIERMNRCLEDVLKI